MEYGYIPEKQRGDALAPTRRPESDAHSLKIHLTNGEEIIIDSDDPELPNQASELNRLFKSSAAESFTIGIDARWVTIPRKNILYFEFN